MSRIILPQGYIKPEDRRLVTPKEHFLEAGGLAPASDVLKETVKNRPMSDADFKSLRTLYSKLDFGLGKDDVPFLAVPGTRQSEINSFRASMKRYKLVAIEDTAARHHLEMTDDLAQNGNITKAQQKLLTGDLYACFARQAKTGEVIIIGDLDAITKGDIAHRFIDAAFYNMHIYTINGETKACVRDQVFAADERAVTPEPARAAQNKDKDSNVLLFPFPKPRR